MPATKALEYTKLSESLLSPLVTFIGSESVPIEEPSTIPSDTLGSVLSADKAESVSLDYSGIST